MYFNLRVCLFVEASDIRHVFKCNHGECISMASMPCNLSIPSLEVPSRFARFRLEEVRLCAVKHVDSCLGSR